MKPVLVALDMQPPFKLAVVASCDIGVGGMPTDTNAVHLSVACGIKGSIQP